MRTELCAEPVSRGLPLLLLLTRPALDAGPEQRPDIHLTMECAARRADAVQGATRPRSEPSNAAAAAAAEVCSGQPAPCRCLRQDSQLPSQGLCGASQATDVHARPIASSRHGGARPPPCALVQMAAADSRLGDADDQYLTVERRPGRCQQPKESAVSSVIHEHT